MGGGAVLKRYKIFREVLALLLTTIMIIQIPVYGTAQEAKQYVITLAYQFADSGHTAAAKSESRVCEENTDCIFHLPAIDPGFMPKVAPRGSGSSEAAERLNECIVEDTQNQWIFKVGQNQWSSFVTDCVAAGLISKNADGNFSTDAAGAIRVQIPIVYHVNGTIPFQVEYLQQNKELNGYTSVDKPISLSITNTAVAHLDQMSDENGNPIVKAYPGFQLTEESKQSAKAAIVSSGSKIQLRYERVIHQIYFDTAGGSPIDPMDAAFGKNITLPTAVTRPGYQFDGWNAAAAANPGKPISPFTTMPDEDVLATAKWIPSKTTDITLEFYLEKVQKSEGYSNVGKQVIKDVSVGLLDYGIQYAENLDFLKNTAKIQDIQFFEYNAKQTNDVNKTTDSKVQVAQDGSTILKLYFDREVFSVQFHMGDKHYLNLPKTIDKLLPNENWNSSILGNIWASWGTKEDFVIEYGKKVFYLPTLTQKAEVYTFSARFGENISHLWPQLGGDGNTQAMYRSPQSLVGWCTYEGAYEKHGAARNVRKYSDYYGIMDSSLVVTDSNGNPQRDNNGNFQVRHLVAEWRELFKNEQIHHIYFECPSNEPHAHPGTDLPFFNTGATNGKGSGAFESKRYYKEVESYTVDSRDTLSEIKNPSRSGMTWHHTFYKDGNSKTGDIYFVFLYTKYTATMVYGGVTQDIMFNLMPTYPADPSNNIVKKRIPPISNPAVGEDPYLRFPNAPQHVQDAIVKKMSDYRFCGWYRDQEFEQKVDWDKDKVPPNDFALYAKWEKLPVTITLVVPGGKISQKLFDTLTNAKKPDLTPKYLVSSKEYTDASGVIITVYTISGVTRGPIANAPELAAIIKAGANSENFDFSHWEKQDGKRYIYNDKNGIGDQMMLTAEWKTDTYETYLVQYLTTTPSKAAGGYYGVTVDNPNGYGSIMLPNASGVILPHYRVKPDKHGSAKVSTMVTEKAAAIPGHQNFMVDSAERKAVVLPAKKRQTVIRFMYTPFTGDITYTVHYVDANTYEGVDKDGTPIIKATADFGRNPPPENSTFKPLWKDKKVTLHISSVSDSVEVTELYESVPGYTVMGHHEQVFMLSQKEEHNHIYFYYQQNNPLIPFTIHAYFQAMDKSYPTVPEIYEMDEQGNPAVKGPLQQIVTAESIANYPQNNIQDSKRLSDFADKAIGHEYDPNYPATIRLQEGTQKAVIKVYMKRASIKLSYDMQIPVAEHADWFKPPAGLVQEKPGSDIYYDSVLWGTKAPIRENPVSWSHNFAGWEYLGELYSQAKPGTNVPSIPHTKLLESLPFYMEKPGITKPVTLKAHWTSRHVVYYDTQGGTWDNRNEGFVIADTENGQTTIMGFVMQAKAPEPQFAPAYTAQDGITHTFIGWTKFKPSLHSEYIEKHHINLDKFEKYRYDFNQTVPKDELLTLYAVWDPPVFSFDAHKTDTSDLPIAGAEFSLERIQSKLENGKIVPVMLNGQYQIETHFPERRFHSDVDGIIHFEYLRMGYYRLTETSVPSGYEKPSHIKEIILAYLPDEGGVKIISPQPDSCLQLTEKLGVTVIHIRNIPQYIVSINAPAEVTYTYKSPEMIWDPVKLCYAIKPGGSADTTYGWTASENDSITVHNASIPKGDLTVTAEFHCERQYAEVQKSSYFETVDSNHTPISSDVKEKTSWILKWQEDLSFRLRVDGLMPFHTPPGGQIIPIGRITVHVSPPAFKGGGIDIDPPAIINRESAVYVVP